MKHYHLQLTAAANGIAVSATGGVCYVAQSGSPKKAAIYTKTATGDFIAASNPVALVNGAIDFYTLDTVQKVDLYGQAPSGVGFIKKGVFPSGDASLPIAAAGIGASVVVIPFSFADGVAATEIQTGFRVPTLGAVMPMPLVEVTAADAGITLEVGTLSSDAGDADGFVDVLSVATTGLKKASLANGATTMGVLLFVQDSANAGDKAPECDVTMQGKQITYTLLTGADTAEGFIRLPVLPAVGTLA